MKRRKILGGGEQIEKNATKSKRKKTTEGSTKKTPKKNRNGWILLSGYGVNASGFLKRGKKKVSKSNQVGDNSQELGER